MKRRIFWRGRWCGWAAKSRRFDIALTASLLFLNSGCREVYVQGRHIGDQSRQLRGRGTGADQAKDGATP
jgi:hypothetical protein